MADRLDWTDGEIGGGDFDGASGLYDEGYEGYEGEGYETCLGGPTHSGPAVTRDPLGRLFLVVMFADGSYRFRSQHAKPKAGQGSTGESTTLGMSDWVSLSGKFSTKPEVVRDSEGFLHVFGRGLDQQLYHRYQMAYPEGPRTRVVRCVPHPSRLAPSPRHTSHSPPPPDSSPLSPLPAPLSPRSAPLPVLGPRCA